MSLPPLYTSAEVREIETSAQREHPSPTLMQRAGLAAADCAEGILGKRARGVLVIAGPGNNGGDAFEAAALLKQRFHRVELLFAGERGRLSADASAALQRWEAAGGTYLGRFPEDAPRRYGLVIDGLFGIGLARSLEGRHAALVDAVNDTGLPVLALDVPSGLNADTGAVMGTAVKAAHTLTFIARKPGLLTLDGPDHAGILHVDALSLDVERLRLPQGRLLDVSSVTEALSPRPLNFHKGHAGNVTVIGGAAGMTGATLLAGRAALACGAGRVHVGMLDGSSLAVDPLQPELMLRAATDAPLEDAVIAVGPGLGKRPQAVACLRSVLRSADAIVVDADALNLIAADAALAGEVAHRQAATLFTPHPAEAARLLGRETRAVQADRLAAALDIARRFHAITALKGNGTIVATPDGRWWINPTGHPGMASAGMGDTLTGIAASLLAQGAAPEAALRAAVWLHGAAGDEVAREHGGPLGTTASDVIVHARSILNRALTSRTPYAS